MSGRFDVVIVGGGLAGLGCAARLARRGLAVRVLERSTQLGGRARSPAVGSVAMNLGPRALYLGGAAERWLEDLGVAWSGFQPRQTDTWLADGGELFAAPSSLFGILGEARFSLGERLGLLRFFGTLDHGSLEPLRGVSVGAWLDRVAPGPRARRLIEALVRLTTYVHAPDALPALCAVRQLRLAMGLRARGVVYLDGGWQALVEGVAAKASEAGASVTTGVTVTSVTDDGRVCVDGEEVVGDRIIVALPVDAARAVYPALASAAAATTPASAACLDLVLSAPPSRRLILDLDEPYYLSVHSPDTETTRVRAHAMRYLAPGESGAGARRDLEAWLQRVAPDAANAIVAARFLPSMVVASARPDVASAGPHPSTPARSRVAFAGDWCAPEHALLDAVAESAESAVRQTLARGERRPAA